MGPGVLEFRSLRCDDPPAASGMATRLQVVGEADSVGDNHSLIYRHSVGRSVAMRRAPYRRKDVMDRIWAKTMTIPECGCYVFMGADNGNGYGVIGTGDGKKMGLVHRVAYERLVGPIPEGLDLDHKCRVRLCWNPDHVEPVTRQINLLRGIGLPAQQIKRTHCPQGHPYDAQNTRIKYGKRECKACDRERHRKKL